MTMLSSAACNETPCERRDSTDVALVTALQELVNTEREYAERLRGHRSSAHLATQCEELIDMAQSQLASTKVAARRGD